MWCRRRRRLVKLPRVPSFVWRHFVNGSLTAVTDDGRRRWPPTATTMTARHVCHGFDPFPTENLRTRALRVFTLVLLLLLPLVESTATGDEHVHRVVALVGDPVTLPCDARADSCGPSHSVKWYKNEQRVYLYSELGKLDRAEGDVAAAGPRAAFVTNATPPYFRLRWTEAADEAQYRCEVTYLRVQDKCPTVTVFNLTVLDPPSPPEVRLNGAIVANGSKQASLLDGDRLNLSCVSREGRPAPLVTWWLAGREVATVANNGTGGGGNSSSTAGIDWSTSKHVQHESIQLEQDQKWTVIRTFELNVDRQHLDSRVECRVQHPAFQSPAMTAFTLDVEVSPSSLELLGPRQAVLAGTRVILVCTAEGARPAANITWFNGTRAGIGTPARVVVDQSDHGTFRTDSRVTFNLTVHEHLANFTCRATNSAAKRKHEEPMEHSIVLEVLYPPIVRTIPSGNITVKEHDSVSLTCDYVANPPNLTRVIWLMGAEPLVLRDNHEITTVNVEGRGFRGFGGGGVGGLRPQLIVHNVTRADQGVYGCALENMAGLGTSVSWAQLGIQHPPEMVISIIPRLVNETSRASVTLRCDIVRANPHALDRVKWYMDGKLLNETGQNELRLTSVTRYGHGDYSCKAHNMAGWGVISQAKHLVVNYPPGLSRLTFSPTIVVKRENVTLMCSVDDYGRPPATQYRWTRGRRLIKEVTSANWTIEPVTLSTDGNFTCVAINEIGDGRSASTYVDVHAPPAFIDRLPHYKGVSVTASSLSMTCRVECDPACRVEWLRNDLLIEPSQHYSLLSVTLPADPSTDDFSSVNSTLTWRLDAWPRGRLDRDRDNANFTCRSSANSVGDGVTSTVYFRVEYPPENISVLPAVLDVAEGDVAGQVRCSAYSYPGSTYVWLLGNQTVGHGDILHLIGPLSRDRGGMYTCVAYNGRGNISATARINVLYKPNCHLAFQSTLKNKVRLVCDAHGNPLTVQFTWGFGNSTLSDDLYVNRKSQSVLTVPNSPAYVGTYTCVANNTIGSSGTCSLYIAGWASESQGWLDKWGDDNLAVVSVVVAAVAVFLIILCCALIVVARRRKSRRKYGDNVELEEREKFLPFSADGQIQLPDGTGPGRPCSLSQSNLPHKCNGSDAHTKLVEGSVPSLYKQICPGVLLPAYNRKVDGTRDVLDTGSIGKSHQIIEHETPNKKHPLRTKSDGTTHYYPDLPIVLDVNHKVNTSAWGSQHEDIRTVEYITAPRV